jgi:hypothetical protein
VQSHNIEYPQLSSHRETYSCQPILAVRTTAKSVEIMFFYFSQKYPKVRSQVQGEVWAQVQSQFALQCAFIVISLQIYNLVTNILHHHILNILIHKRIKNL